MNEIIKQYIQKVSPICKDESGENYGYTVFRIVVAAMFFLHGAQKFFGWIGGIDGAGNAASLLTLPWFAGLIEVVVGVAVLIGMFTRLAALVAIIEMLIAYFLIHLSKGIIPLSNGGELAIMYLASFIVIFRYGAGKLSLEKKYCKGEKF